MKKSFIFTLIFTSILTLACGPERTSQQAEQDQLRQNAAAQKAQLDPWVGTYTGKIVTANKSGPVWLQIYFNNQVINNPGHTDTSEVPNLAVRLNILYGDVNHPGDVADTLIFPTSSLETQIKELSFGSSTPSGGSGSSAVVYTFKFRQIGSTKFVGDLDTRVHSTIEVTRVSQ